MTTFFKDQSVVWPRIERTNSPLKPKFSCEMAELMLKKFAHALFALRYFNRVLVEFQFDWTSIYFGQKSWT